MDNTLRPGTRVDERYTLVRPLGAGATGVVWAATDGPDGALVALKILHRQLYDEPVVVNQMSREHRVLRQLKHPHIAKSWAFRDDGTWVYMAMDLIHGESLDMRLSHHASRREPIPRNLLLQWFNQLCSAIEHAHANQVIHRDLKPQNIMVRYHDSEAPDLVVLDFGIARILEGNLSDATTFGRQLGSIFYMSPEQVSGNQAGPHSDVFALGSILFELISLHRCWAVASNGEPMPAFTTGVPSGPHNSMVRVFERIARGPRPRAKELATIPDELDAVIHRALAIDLKERFRSVAELSIALSTALANLTEPDIPTMSSGTLVAVRTDAESDTEILSGITSINPGFRAANDIYVSPEIEDIAPDFATMTESDPTIGSSDAMVQTAENLPTNEYKNSWLRRCIYFVGEWLRQTWPRVLTLTSHLRSNRQ